MQPTRLKRVGWKTAVVLTAVLIAAVVIYFYATFPGIANEAQPVATDDTRPPLTRSAD